MTLPQFEYLAPHTLEEACAFLTRLGDNCRLVAGGTDVIVRLKDRLIKPAYVMDLKRISGLDYLDYIPGEGLKIGALTTLRTIEQSSMVRQKFAAVAEAAHYVASTQVRNKATMAGNLCNASPSADSAPILIVLGASLKIAGLGGLRMVPVGEFFTGPGSTVLGNGEIVVEISIPEMEPNVCAAYIKHAVRKAMDLAIVGVAVALKVEADTCAEARIAMGAVAPTPIRAKTAEAFLAGKQLSEEVIAEAALTASEECTPISDVRASVEYRKDMVRVFTKRSITKALGSTGY